MQKIVNIDSYKVSKMSVIDRLAYELSENNNMLFGHEYLISDDDDELFMIVDENGKSMGYHVFFLPECKKITVKKDSITLIDNDGATVKLTKDGVDQ